MSKYKILAGTTSYIANVFIQSSTSASGFTGLLYNTSGLTCYYKKNGGASTAITLATATEGTYTSAGFVAVDATNMPGLYEFGIPATVLSSAVNSVIYFQGVAGMAPAILEIELDAINYQDGIRAGLTTLAPNAPFVVGSVASGSSTSGFAGNSGLSATDNFYTNLAVCFTSGVLAGITNKVTGYTGSTKTFAFSTAWPASMSTADTFIIIGRLG